MPLGTSTFRLKSKHRHASLFHHSSLHIAKANKVSDWLNMKTETERSRLMTDARKSAKVLRQKHRIREKEVMKAVRQRMMERAAAMKEREIKATEVKKKLIEEVMAHGGPCRTPEDVESLKANLDPKAFTLALKNEIRYQKVILGVPGLLKLSKPATELKKDLCNHLRGAEAQENDFSDTETENDDEGTDLWQGNYELSDVNCQQFHGRSKVYRTNQDPGCLLSLAENGGHCHGGIQICVWVGFRPHTCDKRLSNLEFGLPASLEEDL